MEKASTFVGLDVHKESIDVTIAEAGALCELLRGAQHIVRIFSDSLSPQLFDHAGLASELSRVARQGRACEVRILLKDSQFLTRRTHRIGALHQRLVSSVLLRKLTYCPDHYVANYVLVDDGGIFFIPNEDDKVSSACTPSAIRWAVRLPRRWRWPRRSAWPRWC